jgi:DNA polymerase III epsilon subunit-like protein
MKGNWIVFDTETGGLDFEKNPITQIALICLNSDNFEEIQKIEYFVKPYKDHDGKELVIEKQSIDRTMVSLNDLNSHGLERKELVKNLIEFFKKSQKSKGFFGLPTLVGHNVNFDIAFLNYLFYLENKDLGKYVSNNNGSFSQIDTQQLFRLFFPFESSINLTACCKIAGISLEDAHGAMNDTICTAELFKWFAGFMNGEKEQTKKIKQEKFRNTFQI